MRRRPPRSTPFPYPTLFRSLAAARRQMASRSAPTCPSVAAARDRKSTRLNSSHVEISYAVFCLKKKKGHRGDQGEHHEVHRRALLRGQPRGGQGVLGDRVRRVPRGQHVHAARFFFSDTGPADIYTLSLHDALPI